MSKDQKRAISMIQDILDAQPEACMLMMKEESETKPLVDRIVYYNKRALEIFGVKNCPQLVSNQIVAREERVVKKVEDQQPYRQY